jgi:hypothetical protein
MPLLCEKEEIMDIGNKSLEGILDKKDALMEFFDFAGKKGKEKKLIGCNQLRARFEPLMQLLDDIYIRWFGRKVFKEEDIVFQIFRLNVKSKGFKPWLKYEMIAMMISLQRVFKNIEMRCQKSHNRIMYGKDLAFLCEMIFESCEFLDYAFDRLEGLKAVFGCSKRMRVTSLEVFLAGQNLFRKEISKNWQAGHVISPTSIFLIRQSLELRLKNALGVNYITNKDGKILRVDGSVFLNLVENNLSEVTLPVRLSYIKTIFSWTNSYIHGGHIHRSWEIEWAFSLLQTLFTPYNAIENGAHRYDVFGAIRINRSLYDRIENEIEASLRKKSKKMNDAVNSGIRIIRLSQPEAMVVD